MENRGVGINMAEERRLGVSRRLRWQGKSTVVLGKSKGRSHRTLRAAWLLRILIVKRHANLFVLGIINISIYFVRINLCREIKLTFTYTLNN